MYAPTDFAALSPFPSEPVLKASSDSCKRNLGSDCIGKSSFVASPFVWELHLSSKPRLYFWLSYTAGMSMPGHVPCWLDWLDLSACSEFALSLQTCLEITGLWWSHITVTEPVVLSLLSTVGLASSARSLDLLAWLFLSTLVEQLRLTAPWLLVLNRMTVSQIWLSCVTK